MNKEKLSLIEKKIIDTKKRELYKEVNDLAMDIREKKHNIIISVKLMGCDKTEALLNSILVESILNDNMQRFNEVYWYKEVEDALLDNGINEILDKQ
ncbi:MFS transporter [Bacillus cereus]|uniref:MFS transporter n=1 Tax=Bacillus cereus TaxID=1396 RepID=UPI003D99DAC4